MKSSRHEPVSRSGPRIRPALRLAVVIVLGACGLMAYVRFKTTRENITATENPPTSQLPVAFAPTSPEKFDAPTVKRLACLAANAKARELYDLEPFDESSTLRPEQTGWKWIARRAHGIGDFEATVHLKADGTIISLEVLRLTSPPDNLY